MMSDSEQHNKTFEAASVGTSVTFPMQCSALHNRGHFFIKGRQCKLFSWNVDMSTSNTGKHGHPNFHLAVINIFINKKFFLNLIEMNGVAKDDVNTPECDLGEALQERLMLAKTYVEDDCS
ncbi:uncharacterized protein MELLADRAFT_88384 [Melampsora larici-populina 98AG31]|uniref:Translation initiation factor 5A-like N-terminal domain-containing protein n=1 Tax=Melampsora larici-populina (strain 98AG31 / pathotype 3-4-7) TaxID=747676 RepID=F4RRI9_MELLP|nr:uncharacterized protein MELLADRAFT_88384 [Melampsora larici-populina 98AG31]EGG05020.1 hypothetical protein MELLADRAFT_88384 [Melampsora larici-populina 98AG31]